MALKGFKNPLEGIFLGGGFWSPFYFVLRGHAAGFMRVALNLTVRKADRFRATRIKELSVREKTHAQLAQSIPEHVTQDVARSQCDTCLAELWFVGTFWAVANVVVRRLFRFLY